MGEDRGRFGPTHDGVILAAGLSTRAGAFKPALPLGDRTVLQRAVEGMYAAVEHIWVVVGWQAERVQKMLAAYGKVTCVLNEDYRAGMFSSVRAGLLRVQAEAFLLLPGDCPLVAADTYRRLCASPLCPTYGGKGEIVIPLYQGRKGHPLLCASRLIPEILLLPPDGNLRDYVARKGYVPLEVQDQGVLLDVDTPEDYRVMAARFDLTQQPDTGMPGSAAVPAANEVDLSTV